MKFNQTEYEVLSIIATGELTLQSLAHSLERVAKCSYEKRVAIASEALRKLTYRGCIRWDFYKNYGNSKPERTARHTHAELLDDLAEVEAFLRDVNFDEERDEVTISIWLSEIDVDKLERPESPRVS